ncbi:MAG TPA: hypothetical protein VLS93_11875 [Anaeromyxobacteraceae bacterium]|nr:hypothetical protein [Anaeromyxobacteraceae bacterium]
MPLDAAFTPYRLAPGALPEEAARAAELLGAGPLVAAPDLPLPSAVLERALAEVPAGRAGDPEEACRAADGTPAGLGGVPRACLVSARHRSRVATAIQGTLAAGFSGVELDRPDAPLALGLLGAGFCAECQRDLARQLAREYGDHFQPIDYLSLAREALAQSPGAVGFGQLPFGRDFVRLREAQLWRAVAAYARTARDAARAAGRPFEIAARFEALGPAQLVSCRHLDAAAFPASLAPGATGIGLARLLRAALGRRPGAMSLSAGAPAGPDLAGTAAAAGIGLAGLEPAGAGGLAGVRRLFRHLASRGRSPALQTPVAECAVFYSAESDRWSGGRHRRAVELAGEALAARHVQAPVVLRVADAEPAATLVLADAQALSPREADEIRRRLEAGGLVLAFGEPGAVDEAGRPSGAFLPAGKPGGARVGSGMLAALPPLAPDAGGGPPEPELLEKALGALLGRGRRAAGVVGRARMLVVLYRSGDVLDVHLVPLGGERAQGTTLFLGVDVAGGVRRARFQASDGSDVRIPMNPSGYSISTVLPAFERYGVLRLPA